jgi:hypothetical protein
MKITALRTPTPDQALAMRRLLLDTDSSLRAHSNQLADEAGRHALKFLRNNDAATKAQALELSHRADGLNAVANRLQGDFRHSRGVVIRDVLASLARSLEDLANMLEREAGTAALNCVRAANAAAAADYRAAAQNGSARAEGYRLGLKAIQDMAMPHDLLDVTL